MANDANDSPTVEGSLQALSEAVAKAADDLRAVRPALDRARADISSRDSSLTRHVVAAATRTIDHLRGADEALRDVLKELEQRD